MTPRARKSIRSEQCHRVIAGSKCARVRVPGVTSCFHTLKQCSGKTQRSAPNRRPGRKACPTSAATSSPDESPWPFKPHNRLSRWLAAKTPLALRTAFRAAHHQTHTAFLRVSSPRGFHRLAANQTPAPEVFSGPPSRRKPFFIHNFSKNISARPHRTETKHVNQSCSLSHPRLANPVLTPARATLQSGAVLPPWPFSAVISWPGNVELR